MSSVRVEGVSKSFGTTSVLRGVDLEIPSGAFAAVLGRSGCGKTTLLRLLAGFERPDAGRLLVGDRVVDDGRSQVPAHRRRIGYVPQDGLLFPHLDVAQNVAFGLPRGRGREARVRELLELVGLAGLERRRPDELSGGQQQRVALARALAPGPDLVLLDEPFAALDARLRDGLRTDVKSILAGAETTVLLVTHDQEEALSLADQVAVLEDGLIAQTGSPQELYERPASLEIARFMGAANLVPALADGSHATSPLGALPLLRDDLPRGAAVLLFLRAEQVELVDPADAPGAPLATVGDTSYFGHDALVTLAADAGGTRLALVARTTGSRAPAPSQRVALRFRGSVVAFEAPHAHRL